MWPGDPNAGAASVSTEHGPFRRPARRAAIRVIAAGVALAIACSSSGEKSREAAEGVAPPTAKVATQAAAIGTEAHRALVDRVNIVTRDATVLLNQTALFIVSNDDARPQLEEDVRLLLGSFQLQREILQQAEPVPAAMQEAHELLAAAMERYVEATALLLPQSSGGPERFDFFAFQSLMQEGGEQFHGAGAALP